MYPSVHDNIAECIGQTPIIRLNENLVPASKRLYLKLEYYNPTFSIKDRTALGLVKAAMASGKLQKGGVLIESTSGNLGKSLAMLGAVYGFRVIVVIDPKISPSVLKFYKAYGAEVDIVHETDENGGYQKTRVARVRTLLKSYANAFWPNQYDNGDNPDFHYRTTGAEVADFPVDAVVGCVSTGGHLCGISRKVKETRPQTTTIACDVEGSSVFGGQFRPYLVNGVGLSWRCRNIDMTVLDKVCISSDQEAVSICRLLAKDCGVMLGGSAGLVVLGAMAWLAQSRAISALAIVPDAGINYLEQIYDDDWLADKGILLLDRDEISKRIKAKPILDPRDIEPEGNELAMELQH